MVFVLNEAQVRIKCTCHATFNNVSMKRHISLNKYDIS